MRVGASINKRRIVDVCVAKGDDTRGDVLDAPFFRYAQAATEVTLSISGELILRNEIKQGTTLLNTNIQNQPLVSTFIGLGDSQNRFVIPYPTGELELHQRLTRTQVRNIQSIDFFRNTAFSASYAVNYIDISKFTELLFLRAGLVRILFLNLKNARKLQVLRILSHNFTTLDISDNTDLRILDLGQDTSGNITTVVTASAYNAMTSFNVANNKMTSFPSLVAPELTTLIASFNTNLGNAITYANYPKLLDLQLANCGLTSLNLTSNPLLKFLTIGATVNGANNVLTSNLNLSSNLDLETLIAPSCGITSLNLTNNTKLRTLNLGQANNGANLNNLGANLTGLFGLSELRTLNLRFSSSVYSNMNLDAFPNLQLLILNGNTGISGNLIFTVANNNLVTIDLRGTNVSFFDTNFTPFLTEFLINDGNGINQIDFTKLTRLTSLNAFITSTGNCTVIDLRNGINTMSTVNVNANSVITSLFLPARQVTNLNQVFNCPNLSTFVVNNISRTNTSVNFSFLRLSVLDTSFGATNCFPNLLELAIGGGVNDTYTSTKVYDDRKNNFTAFAGYRNFIVSGQLGIDTMAACTFINIDCDADISYTAGSSNFGSVMRRVFLRPKIGSGLATSGNQVANLLIDLSNKTWSSNATNTAVGFSSPRLIDLRGNCAVATPSTALTTALALLTTKGVTVLRN